MTITINPTYITALTTVAMAATTVSTVLDINSQQRAVHCMRAANVLSRDMHTAENATALLGIDEDQLAAGIALIDHREKLLDKRSARLKIGKYFAIGFGGIVTSLSAAATVLSFMES